MTTSPQPSFHRGNRAEEIEYRGPKAIRLGVWMAVPVLAGLAFLAIGVSTTNGTFAIIYGGAMTAIFVPMYVLTLVAGHVRVVLRNDSLQIPNGIRRIQIPLEMISGVLLVNSRGVTGTRSATPKGWFLNIWDTTGRSYLVNRVGVRAGPDESVREDLESSAAGVFAKQVYDRVLEVQGPSGCLATGTSERSPKFNPFAPRKVLAWWAPDGSVFHRNR